MAYHGYDARDRFTFFRADALSLDAATHHPCHALANHTESAKHLAKVRRSLDSGEILRFAQDDSSSHSFGRSEYGVPVVLCRDSMVSP